MPTNQVAFRGMDLEAIDRTLYEPKYEELTARQILNLKTDVDPGAETYGYDVMTRSGVAKIIANNADDVPLVDVDMRREFQRIYTIATGFKYSVQEQRAASMQGKTLDSTKAGVARRAVAEKENRLAWIGDADFGILGLINTTGIQTTNVAASVGTPASTKWSNKSGQEIVEDVRIVRSLISVLPGHMTSPLTLGLPPTQYEILNSRYNDYDARSVLQVIQGFNWFSSIVRVPELKGAGTAGSDSMLIFDSSREVMELLIPMDMIRHEPEWKFPNWKFVVEERCGGVIVRYPMAIVRGDGI